MFKLKTCVATSLTLLCFVSSPDAAFRRGAVAVTSGFSGGKIQVQSAFLYSPGDYPYINYFRGKAADWTYTHNNQSVNPADLTAKGYPTTMVNGQYQSVVAKPPQASIGNPNWVWRFSGNATTFVDGVSSCVVGSLTGSGGSGYCEFSTTEDFQFRVGVANLNGSFIDDIELYRKDQESYRNAGETFNPDHVNLLKSGNKVGVVRYLDYQYGNTTTIVSWDTRKRVGYYSYAAGEYRPNLLVTPVTYTANTGTDYAVTGNGTGIPSSGPPTNRMLIHLQAPITNVAPSSAVTYSDGSSDLTWNSHPLVVGDPVQLNFGSFAGLYADGEFFKPSETMYVVSTTTNTFRISKTPGGTARVFAAHPGGATIITRPSTLNLNGTGKVIIGDYSGLAIPAGAFNTTNYMTFLYDSTLNVWLAPGYHDGFVPASGIVNGMPPEDILALAVKVGAHPHTVSPVYAVDPTGDWATGFATFMQANKPAWMIPRFQGSNEIFNSFGGFITGPYMVNVGRVLWNQSFSDTFIAGRQLRTLGQQVGAVFGPSNKGITYDVLLGVKTIDSIGGATTFRNPGTAAGNANPIATSEIADGFRIVNLNTSGPNVSTFDGLAHGKSIGDPLFFAPDGNNMPANLSASTKYYVANNANFSSTAFDITTVPGGGSFGQPGIAPGSGGNAPYSMLAGTEVQPSSVATTIVVTNYVNPVIQQQIAESVSALNYYANDNSIQKAANLASYVTNSTVTSGIVVGSISGTTLHVTSIVSGSVARLDSAIVGAGVTADTYLTAQLATSPGDVATFSVNNSQTVVGGTTMRFAPLRNYTQAWAYWGRNLPFPINKVAGYEGGWSPDYASPGPVTGNLNSVVTAMSNANPAVLTLTDTNNFGNFIPGANPAVVNAYVMLTGLTGGYATYNGQIVQITNVAGGSVTINLDASSQGAPFSGTANVYFAVLKGTATASITGDVLTVTAGTLPLQYDFVGYGTNSAQVSSGFGNVFNLYPPTTPAGSQTMNIYTSPLNIINGYRGASKNAPELKDVTITNYSDFYAVQGGEFPSVYFLSGGSVWGVWDPSYYQTTGTPTQWQAVQEYNFLLKRDLDPASKDSDPMWIQKAA